MSETPENTSDKPHCVENACALHNSCIYKAKVDEEGVAPVLSLIDIQFGGWPILSDPSWSNATFNLLSLLLKLHQYNYNIIYGISIDVDKKNS